MAGDRDTGDTSWGTRFAAPIALIVATIAVIAVIGGSSGSGGSAGERSGGDATQTTTTTDAKETPKAYVVQPDDNLSQIAAKFALSVDEIVKLNPDVDPQALAPGTKLKLR